MTAPRSPFPDRETDTGTAITGTLKLALLMSSTYIAFAAIGISLRAVLQSPPLEVTVRDMPAPIRHTLEILSNGWILAGLIWFARFVSRYVIGYSDPDPRRGRWFNLAILAIFVLPYGTYWVETVLRPGVLLHFVPCLPATAFALWSIQRMQRYRRVPARLPLMAFLWGALIAPGYAASAEYFSILLSYRVAPPADPGLLVFDGQHATMLFFSAGLFEELAKGAGIVIVFFFGRRHIDGVVSGIVIGAATGLGFNLTESIGFMSQNAATQFWLRQSVGLMAAHTAFSAVVGAGLGLAQRRHDGRFRNTSIACGFAAAIGAHFGSDAILWAQQKHHWLATDPNLNVLLVLPAAIVVLQGPFVAMYLWLLRHGLRGQAYVLSTELEAEADTGLGAVTDAEVTVLLDPSLRFWLKIAALRRHGVAAYRQLGRLHAAQFDLATQRGRDAGSPIDGQDGDLQRLRDRVLDIKSRQIVTVRSFDQPEAST